MTLAIEVRLTARAGRASELTQALLRIRALSEGYPGCVCFYAHTDPAREGLHVVYEQWADQAALDVWLADPRFVEILEGSLNPVVADFERTELDLLAPS